MKRLVALSLLIVVSGWDRGGWQAAAAPTEFNGHRRPFTIVEPVRVAPITPMHTPSHGVTNLTRYRGRVVLLNLWATWCAPCRAELPHLDQLQRNLGTDGLTVLTVATDDAPSNALVSFFRHLGIRSLNPLSDPAGHAAGAFGAYDGLPWSFIIDRQGNLRGYIAGAADWTGKQAHDMLKYYLAQP